MAVADGALPVVVVDALTYMVVVIPEPFVQVAAVRERAVIRPVTPGAALVLVLKALGLHHLMLRKDLCT